MGIYPIIGFWNCSGQYVFRCLLRLVSSQSRTGSEVSAPSVVVEEGGGEEKALCQTTDVRIRIVVCPSVTTRTTDTLLLLYYCSCGRSF